MKDYDNYVFDDLSIREFNKLKKKNYVAVIKNAKGTYLRLLRFHHLFLSLCHFLLRHHFHFVVLFKQKYHKFLGVI